MFEINSLATSAAIWSVFVSGRRRSAHIYRMIDILLVSNSIVYCLYKDLGSGIYRNDAPRIYDDLIHNSGEYYVVLNQF